MNRIILIFCFLISFNVHTKEFNGLFGFKMGQVIDNIEVYDPNGNPPLLNRYENFFEVKLDYDNYHYTELESAGNISMRFSYLVQPLIQNDFFTEYKLFYSPLSHRIVEIKAVGERIPDEDRCKVILSNIYFDLVLKYSRDHAINSRISIADFNIGRNYIFIDVDKNDLKKEEGIITDNYLENLFDESSFTHSENINDEFVKQTYDYILSLRNTDFEAINKYVIELNCFGENFNLSIKSPELKKMSQSEKKIIRKWAELIRYSYINADVDTDGF